MASSIVPYKSVDVAIMYWKGGDLDKHIRDELEIARHAFRRFDFDISTIEIHKNNSQDTLHQDLGVFYQRVARKKEPKLAILLYNGHGGANGGVMWLSRGGQHFVNWTRAQEEVVSQQPVDQIVVMDCCFAGSAIGANPMPGFNMHYILASDQEVTSTGLYSLTRTLTAALEQLEDQSFTVHELWGRLERLQYQRLADAEYYAQREAGGLTKGRTTGKYKASLAREREAAQEAPPNIFRFDELNFVRERTIRKLRG